MIYRYDWLNRPFSGSMYKSQGHIAEYASEYMRVFYAGFQIRLASCNMSSPLLGSAGSALGSRGGLKCHPALRAARVPSVTSMSLEHAGKLQDPQQLGLRCPFEEKCLHPFFITFPCALHHPFLAGCNHQRSGQLTSLLQLIPSSLSSHPWASRSCHWGWPRCH